MANLIGADCVPALCAGKLVDKGLNHMIICKQKIVVPDEPEHLVALFINMSPTTDREVLPGKHRENRVRDLIGMGAYTPIPSVLKRG